MSNSIAVVLKTDLINNPIIFPRSYDYAVVAHANNTLKIKATYITLKSLSSAFFFNTLFFKNQDTTIINRAGKIFQSSPCHDTNNISA